MKKAFLLLIIPFFLAGCSSEETAVIDCEQYRAELVATYQSETITDIFYSPAVEACLFVATKEEDHGYLKTLSNYSTNDILNHITVLNDEHENSIATKEFNFKNQLESYK